MAWKRGWKSVNPQKLILSVFARVLRSFFNLSSHEILVGKAGSQPPRGAPVSIIAIRCSEAEMVYTAQG